MDQNKKLFKIITDVEKIIKELVIAHVMLSEATGQDIFQAMEDICSKYNIELDYDFKKEIISRTISAKAE